MQQCYATALRGRPLTQHYVLTGRKGKWRFSEGETRTPSMYAFLLSPHAAMVVSALCGAMRWGGCSLGISVVARFLTQTLGADVFARLVLGSVDLLTELGK